jgi:hypothetical protein
MQKNNLNFYLCSTKKKEADTRILFNFVRITHLWNNLHQVRSKSKDWKAKLFGSFGARKPKSLNRIVKISYGYLNQ